MDMPPAELLHCVDIDLSVVFEGKTAVQLAESNLFETGVTMIAESVSPQASARHDSYLPPSGRATRNVIVIVVLLLRLSPFRPMWQAAGQTRWSLNRRAWVEAASRALARTSEAATSPYGYLSLTMTQDQKKWARA
jgi:hypothetical protein